MDSPSCGDAGRWRFKTDLPIGRHLRERPASGPLGPAISAGRADLFRRDVAFAEVEEVLVRVMYVLPARAVKIAAGECDLRPMLLEDQPLGFENRLNAPVIVERSEERRVGKGCCC